VGKHSRGVRGGGAAERLAAVLRAATSYAVTATDERGLITLFNEGAEQMLGYRADEVVGKLTPLALHDPDEVRARAAELGIAPGFEVLVAAARLERPETREWTYLRRDGSRLTVELTVTSIHGPGGGRTGFLGIATDVSERRRAEAEGERLLRKAEAAEARLRALIDSAPDAIVVVDGDGRIELANPKTETLFGYRHDELVGQPVELLVPESVRLRHPAFRSVYLAGSPPAGMPLELRGRRKDGSEFPAEISLSPRADEDGAHVTAVVRDVTERHRLLEAERIARAAAEDLATEREAILRQVADGVILVDTCGQISYVNRAGRRLLGLPASDRGVTHLRRRLVVDGRRRRRLEKLPLVRAALRGETVVDAELRIGRPGGREAVVLGSAQPVVAEDGTALGAVLTLHDVTAQRELERQKDELFANVSHDLRTPVAVVKTSVGVVLANEPADMPEALHRMLVNADLAADRLTSLVDDLLELARVRAGRVQLRLASVDLRAVAGRAAEAIRPLAQARRQRLELDLPAGPVTATIDPPRLERALLNLLSNAHKHGRDGGAIHLTLARRGRIAELAVSDDGPGIAPDDQARIFDRFHRAGPEAARRSDGTGLGLPIARALTELHGGRITLESAPGAGATFRLLLPLPRQESDPRRPRRGAGGEAARTRDDDTGLPGASALGFRPRREDPEVPTAADGKAGPDVVRLDVAAGPPAP
jgi:PAS domain S-box-containing protein